MPARPPARARPAASEPRRPRPPGHRARPASSRQIGVGVREHRPIDGLRQTVKAEDLQRHRLSLSARVRRDPNRPGEPGQRSTTRMATERCHAELTRRGPGRPGGDTPGRARPRHRSGARGAAGGPAPRHRAPDRDGDSARWNPGRDDIRASAAPRQVLATETDQSRPPRQRETGRTSPHARRRCPVPDNACPTIRTICPLGEHEGQTVCGYHGWPELDTIMASCRRSSAWMSALLSSPSRRFQ